MSEKKFLQTDDYSSSDETFLSAWASPPRNGGTLSGSREDKTTAHCVGENMAVGQSGQPTHGEAPSVSVPHTSQPTDINSASTTTTTGGPAKWEAEKAVEPRFENDRSSDFQAIEKASLDEGRPRPLAVAKCKQLDGCKEKRKQDNNGCLPSSKRSRVESVSLAGPSSDSKDSSPTNTGAVSNATVSASALRRTQVSTSPPPLTLENIAMKISEVGSIDRLLDKYLVRMLESIAIVLAVSGVGETIIWQNFAKVGLGAKKDWVVGNWSRIGITMFPRGTAEREAFVKEYNDMKSANPRTAKEEKVHIVSRLSEKVGRFFRNEDHRPLSRVLIFKLYQAAAEIGVWNENILYDGAREYISKDIEFWSQPLVFPEKLKRRLVKFFPKAHYGKYIYNETSGKQHRDRLVVWLTKRHESTLSSSPNSQVSCQQSTHATDGANEAETSKQSEENSGAPPRVKDEEVDRGLKVEVGNGSTDIAALLKVKKNEFDALAERIQRIKNKCHELEGKREQLKREMEFLRGHKKKAQEYCEAQNKLKTMLDVDGNEVIKLTQNADMFWAVVESRKLTMDPTIFNDFILAAVNCVMAIRKFNPDGKTGPLDENGFLNSKLPV